MPFVFIGIIGTGFLFTFYDIFDINVSFIQTCVELKRGCTPANALTTLRIPIVLNLAGYVFGALILSPVSDRIGRRNMLLITLGITAAGSLYNALAPDYTNFVIARIITGIGVGADLAIINTFVGEVAPRRQRARWISVIFIMSSLGALLGIWLGLILTTPSAPWPDGLPFAAAGPHFTTGWRWMYGIGALLAVVGIALRVRLPESPRWLVARGRLEEADGVVSDMERTASRHGPLAPVRDDVPMGQSAEHGRAAYRALFGDRLYAGRVLLLLSMWFLAYVTVYGFAAGFTTFLTSLKYPPPEAGLIVAVGAFGFLACALFAAAFAERMERKLWLPFGAVITLIGGVIIAEAGKSLAVSFIGSAVVFFGFNVWVPITYALSTEHFPTRARATGFALVDGIGHLGGGIGVLLIAPVIPHLTVLEAFMLVGSFQVVAAVIVQRSERTRGRHYEEISP